MREVIWKQTNKQRVFLGMEKSELRYSQVGKKSTAEVWCGERFNYV